MKRWFKGIVTGFTVEHVYSLLPAVTGLFFSWLGGHWGPETGGYDESGLSRKRQSLQPLVVVVLAQCTSPWREGTVGEQGLGDECWLAKKWLIKSPLSFKKNDAETTETFSSHQEVYKDRGNYLWSCQRRSCHTSDTNSLWYDTK